MGSYFIKESIITKYITFAYKYFFVKSRFIFVQNTFDKNLFLKNYKIKRDKLILLPGSGVNLKKYYPKFIFNDYCISFLMVSRLIYEKGIEEFYYASKMAFENNVNLKFHLIGNFDTNNRNTISIDFFNKIKNCNHIKYENFSDNLLYKMHKFDCFVLPSYREGMSKFLLEGLALGKPLLVSDAPGCKELCNNKNGYIFKKKSTLSLYRSIEKISKKQKKEMIEMGKQSRKLSERSYDNNLMISSYNDVLKKLI